MNRDVSKQKTTGLRLFFWRARLLLLKPTAFTLISWAVWYYVVRGQFGHYLSAVDSQVAISVAGLIGVFHALIASRTYGERTKERDGMHESAFMKEWTRFVWLRDKRIEWYTHWMLVFFSGALILALYVVRFDSPVTGTVAVAGVSFVIAVFYQTAMVADNPDKRDWDLDSDSLDPECRTMTMEEARNKMREERPRLYVFR